MHRYNQLISANWNVIVVSLVRSLRKIITISVFGLFCFKTRNQKKPENGMNVKWKLIPCKLGQSIRFNLQLHSFIFFTRAHMRSDNILWFYGFAYKLCVILVSFNATLKNGKDQLKHNSYLNNNNNFIKCVFNLTMHRIESFFFGTR